MGSRVLLTTWCTITLPLLLRSLTIPLSSNTASRCLWRSGLISSSRRVRSRSLLNNIKTLILYYCRASSNSSNRLTTSSIALGQSRSTRNSCSKPMMRMISSIYHWIMRKLSTLASWLEWRGNSRGSSSKTCWLSQSRTTPSHSSTPVGRSRQALSGSWVVTTPWAWSQRVVSLRSKERLTRRDRRRATRSNSCSRWSPHPHATTVWEVDRTTASTTVKSLSIWMGCRWDPGLLHNSNSLHSLISQWTGGQSVPPLTSWCIKAT